ncbi:Uncharacterised protein [Porphyromonas macacae]|uniref:CDP-alcohol phosphatidyltransferase n=2 Tax=Porphyromonas macacae TaxID=28115 RepID=A0A379E7G8_9PORP|nr:CDP-alcohol phosphatidyltransferase family protein [Porphyromonas macacae]SUB88635.1 Uncharacterised protein [Porphyromonas macacae]
MTNLKNDIKMAEAKKAIAKDRERTNVLRKGEQTAIAWLVQRIPSWITSNGLTAIGFMGNVIVGLSFILGAYINRYWLLICSIGFFISWFGDSLDGRLAYYRNKPRKWFGFCLDITVDWFGIVLIGLGFIFYAAGFWKLIGFAFVAMYGGEMIVSQLRYKVSDQYSIDSGVFGPTEVRILLAAMISLEAFVPGTLNYLGLGACIILTILHFLDVRALLRTADERDTIENAEKLKNKAS